MVQRIFAEFAAGRGLYAIAEGLTQDRIPTPSAHDHERNRNRSGLAWNKRSVREILANPRYTGHQVWSRQRKDEVLIDVEDVALRPQDENAANGTDKWVWSRDIVQPPIIDREFFDATQVMLAGRATRHAQHKPHRAQHPYALRGCVWCGLCGRRMASHWVNGLPYYRCRFTAEYVRANQIDHPLNVSLRESLVVGEVDRWLAREFDPLCLTVRIRAAAQRMTADSSDGSRDAKRRIAECERKLGQYRAALDAGASPAVVAGWIAETEAERQSYILAVRRSKSTPPMTETEIRSLAGKLARVTDVLSAADADGKSEAFRQLGLRLTYHPGSKMVEAKIEPVRHWLLEVCRGRGPRHLRARDRLDVCVEVAGGCTGQHEHPARNRVPWLR